MLKANRQEQELIIKFIDKAQEVIDGTKILFVEKFDHDSDCYLRLGLEIAKEIDVDNSADLDLIRKIASALPIHPKYKLSVTYVDVCDKDHALYLSFLPPKYVSQKTLEKKSLTEKTFDKYFRHVYVIRGGWRLTVMCLFAMLLVFLYFKYVITPVELMPYLSDALMRNRASDQVMPETRKSEAARKEAQQAAIALENALEKYDIALKEMGEHKPQLPGPDSAKPLEHWSEQRLIDKRNHIYWLNLILRNDSYVGDRD